MDKTPTEQKNEDLVIQHIAHLQVSSNERSAYFKDFHNHSRGYYEDLCELLYTILLQHENCMLWMCHNGEVLTHAKDDLTTRFLAKSEDLPVYDGDIINQINFVLNRVSGIKSQSSDSFVNPVLS